MLFFYFIQETFEELIKLIISTPIGIYLDNFAKGFYNFFASGLPTTLIKLFPSADLFWKFYKFCTYIEIWYNFRIMLWWLPNVCPYYMPWSIIAIPFDYAFSFFISKFPWVVFNRFNIGPILLSIFINGLLNYSLFLAMMADKIEYGEASIYL